MSFGTMPFRWIERAQLKEFSPNQGVTGRHIAALKCYLALAAYRDFRDGFSILSTSDLAQIGGLSRPMVLEGIAMLGSMGLVEVDLRAARNTNRYRLVMENGLFRKVPQDCLLENLPKIGNRGDRYLDALKLYCALLYLRDEDSNKATVSHKKLIEYTGVRPEAVAAATSALAACNFVHIRLSEEWSKSGFPTNEYELLGDFAGKRRYRERPVEERRRPDFRKERKSKPDEE
jgi:hypothetical protein